MLHKVSQMLLKHNTVFGRSLYNIYSISKCIGGNIAISPGYKIKIKFLKILDVLPSSRPCIHHQTLIEF